MELTFNIDEVRPTLIDWRKLPKGTVVEFAAGVKAVVCEGETSLDEDKVLILLTFTGGEAWFVMAKGYANEAVAKVLGTITKIE